MRALEAPPALKARPAGSRIQPGSVAPDEAEAVRLVLRQIIVVGSTIYDETELATLYDDLLGREVAEQVQVTDVLGPLLAVSLALPAGDPLVSDVSGGLGTLSRLLRMVLQSGVLGVGAYLAIEQEARASGDRWGHSHGIRAGRGSPNCWCCFRNEIRQ
jgi:hypothetical protein